MSDLLASALHPSSASRPVRTVRQTLLAGGLLGTGCLLNAIAYESLLPLAVFVLVFVFGQCLLMMTRFGGAAERAMFVSTFAIGWFAAGVAAVYANYLFDPFQNESDAANFYELATITGQVSVAEIARRSEGAASVMLWKWVYDLFAMLGFGKGRYIGILVNVFAVACTGVIAVKIARVTHGNDPLRLGLLQRMFLACGMFWLFASLHIRDAVVLLSVTALLYFWVRYLRFPKISNLLFLGMTTLLGFAVLGLLRAEFAFVPGGMLMAGLAAIILYDDSKGLRKAIVYCVALLGLAVAAALLVVYGGTLLRVLEAGQEFYSKTIDAADSGGSLGAQLLALPLPLRLVFGSVYLFVFPIPAWSGFQLESAYHLFKSFNVFFMYALIPLFLVALHEIFRAKARRTPATMFLLFVVIGFTLAVAGTSMETRHFGTFFVPLMVFSLAPDLREVRTRREYRILLVLVVGVMVLIHLIWAILKAGT